MAPMTGLSPMRLSKAMIGHTSLRGTSVVRKLSLRVNSVICMRGKKRVVPGVANISASTHFVVNRGMGFVARYPRYNDGLVECRKRTTRCYPGRATYPPRVGKGVRRFVDQGTVGVSKLKPRAISVFCHLKLVRSATSLCRLAASSVENLSHVKSGSTRGVVGKVVRDGRMPFREMVFTLNVHFMNRAMTGGVTGSFGSVRRLRGTSLRALVGVSRVNRGVTQDVLGCFTGRSGHGLMNQLGATKLRLCEPRRSLDKRASGLTKRSVIVDKMFACRSESRCGSLVRGRNNGGIKDVSSGADFVLTKSGVKPTGLRGTDGLKVGVVGRRRFLGLVSWRFSTVVLFCVLLLLWGGGVFMLLQTGCLRVVVGARSAS